MMHTKQTLEKTSRAPCTLSALIPSTSTDRCVLLRKQANAEQTGGNTCTTPPTKPQALLFLTHAPPARLLPPPTTTTTHPLLATQGHASRLCMTARNVSCHKCFPKASTFVTLSADKTSRVRLSLFWTCQQFLAGWPNIASWRCLLHVCHVCTVCLWIYLHLRVFSHIKPGKRAMSFFHNLIRSYTQERAAAAGSPWSC